MKSGISKFILLLLSLCLPSVLSAQNDTVSAGGGRIRGVQFDSPARSAVTSLPLFAGFSMSANLAGALLSAVSSYGEYEGAVRVNLRGKYFPVVEGGIGYSDHTDAATSLHYRTSSPFFRVGADYNVLKDKTSCNRALAGVRIGYSSFSYDVSGEDITDPYWNTSVPYDFRSLHASQLWIELVGGVETQIWKCLHLGWTVRYKNRISASHDDIGEAWYVPGFGKNGTTAIGVTFNLIIDITRR